MCRFDDIIEACRKNNMLSVAITDHGNMYGIVEFASAMTKAGIKPILGMETYVVDDLSIKSREKKHLVLLVKNEKGYKNLIKISSFAFTEGFYYKPSVDKKFLEQHSEGLIALSSCLQGEVPTAVLNNDMETAKKAAEWYLKTFGEGNFYLELQNHGLEEQVIANRGLREISNALSIPTAATNDVHYMKKDDDKAHEILMCVQTGQTLNSEKRMRFTSGEFYFKSQSEMKAALPEDVQALYNTFDIASKCNFELPMGNQYYMPAYNAAGENVETAEYFNAKLEKMAGEALVRRYKKVTREIQERFNREIGIIKKLGYAGYFLIVMDIIEFARKNDIPVGPGRGSAAGSIVSYALGITGLDPMRYGLLFERFLNPDRVSPPDIDIDFSDEERGKIIDYIVSKFGRDKVAQIITFQTLKARQSIRDVGRVLDVPIKDVDALAKKVPETLNVTFEQVLADPGFSRFVATSPLKEIYEKIIAYSVKIEGLLRQGSTHAAGVVIAPKPITEFAPVAVPDEDEKSFLKQMTQYPMESLDKIGLLKFDILGLRNLSVIKNTLASIKENTGKEIVLENENFDNPEVYKLLASGETSGVFQLESEGMKDLLKKMQPTVFEDIIAIISLFRPGPMQFIDDYIRAKKGLQKVSYDFPELEPVLKETYGIAIYQEQVMEIAVRIAGFTLAEADNLRRAMSKKKVKEMEKIRNAFIAGALKKGIEKEKAGALFEKLDQFSQYGFNKSHAAAYAVLSYQTAYLKALYAGEYMAALLTSVMDKIEKSAFYVNDCRRMGIKIAPPDVNKSEVAFKFSRSVILYGLAAIKNVGVSAAEEIVRNRKENGEYKDLMDFCSRVSGIVNSKAIESLIKGGAFDFTFMKRSQLLDLLPSAIKEGEKARKEAASGQVKLFEEPQEKKNVRQMQEFTENQLLAFEKEVLGTYISAHPLARYEKLLKNVAVPIKEILESPPESLGMVITGGIAQRVKSKVTGKDQERLNFYLEDMDSEIWVFVNEKLTAEKREFFRENNVFMARGRVSFFEDRQVMHLESVISMEEAYEKLGKFLHIRIRELGMEELTMNEINTILSGHRGGSATVIIHVLTKDNKELVLTLAEENKTMVSEELLRQLEQVVGEENIWLSWKKY